MIGVAILGGVLCLDRVFLQAIISRPIVTGPVIGTFLGDPCTGLITGSFVELIWIDRLPIGNHIPPNETIAAVLITAGSIEAGNQLGQLPPSLIALSFLLFFPMGYVGQAVESWIKYANTRLAQQAERYAREGNMAGIARCHRTGLWKVFLSSVILIIVPLIAGTAITVGVYPQLPVVVLEALHYTYFVIPLIGIAVALNTIKVRGTIPLFTVFFLILAWIVAYL